MPPEAVFNMAVPPSFLISFSRSCFVYLPGTTWKVNIFVNWLLLSGLRSVSTVPAGNPLNAALVGANTVKGPLPCHVSTRPAAFTAATRVVWSLEFSAFSTIFFWGRLAAPTTLTVAAQAEPVVRRDRKRVVEGKGWSVRVELGGRQNT